MTIPPPGYDFSPENCPKCDLPVDSAEVSIQCPRCFAVHHRRCVHEGVRCGNLECDYVFSWDEEENSLVFPEYAGPERRGADRRKEDAGPPGGVERRVGPRRRADF